MFYELAEKALALEKQGKRMIRLNVGDTGLPAPQCAFEAVVNNIEKSRRGYGSSGGMQKLLDIIAQREGVEPKNIVVGPGSKHLIYALFSVLSTKEKRKVFFPAPYWPAYELACKQLDLEILNEKSTLENGWQFSGIPKEANIALLCNPLNPTSTIYDDALMKRSIAEAQENGIYVLVDEAYRGIAFRDIPKFDGIKIRSFSKEFNMENWRLGYAVAPEEIVQKVIKFNQITITCVPEFLQKAGIACLENEKEIVSQNRKIWQGRMELMQKSLALQGFRFAKSEAGMYVFATHDGIKDADKFALELLDLGVAVAPGDSFGKYPNFIRICANQPAEVLEEAIEKMGQVANK